jgi:hypothetical protein
VVLFAGAPLNLSVAQQRAQLHKWHADAIGEGVAPPPPAVIEADAAALLEAHSASGAPFSTSLSSSSASSSMSPAAWSSHLMPEVLPALFAAPAAAAALPEPSLGECLSIDFHPAGTEMVISNNQGGMRVYQVGINHSLPLCPRVFVFQFYFKSLANGCLCFVFFRFTRRRGCSPILLRAPKRRPPRPRPCAAAATISSTEPILPKLPRPTSS